MRKEVFFAILAGVSIGLVVAFGIWKVTKLVKKNPPKIARTETPTPKTTNIITIDGLANYDVVNTDPIIKGLTSPNIDIVISTLSDDYYVKSNQDGEFEKEIEIPAGLSEIKIMSVNSDVIVKLLLVYSTEVENQLKSYIGTITDISSGNIQVKSNSGVILQISTNEETTYINTLKKNIEVKQTDLAIGDYIVAIGNINTNKVLASSRILISSTLSENKIEVKKIAIEKLTKTAINEIALPKTWNGPEVKELEVGQEIIIVNTVADEKSTLRTIFTFK